MVRLKSRVIIFYTVCLQLFCTHLLIAQSKPLPAPEGFFAAVIVDDIDTSISWYQRILGLELVNRNDVPERGFSQANLRRGMMDVELIELNNSVSQEEALKNQPNSNRIQGLFKVGFQVDQFDQWLEHLTTEKAEFGGNVVNDPATGKRMLIIKDPDSNRIQIFEK